MATKPKNKTSLRVGQTVWTETLAECEVTKLDVLSNKIIYFEAILKGNNRGYIFECVMENFKGCTDARPLSYVTRNIYIDEQRAKSMAREFRDWEECYHLGYNLKNIARTLKTIRI